MPRKKRVFERPALISSRILAFIMDLIIIDVIILSSFHKQLIFFSKVSLNSITNNNPFLLTAYVKLIPLFLLIITYFFLFEYLVQTTPGKFMLGIIVEDESGKEPSMIKCLIKNILYFPSWLFIIWWVIDLYYLFKNKIRLTEKLLRMKTVQIIKVNN